MSPASEEDSDPGLARRIKTCKQLWLSLQSQSRNSTNLPTRTSNFLKHRNKNVDTTPRYRMTIKLDSLGIRGMNVCWGLGKLSVQLLAEQSDWLADTDEDIDEQELEAHYSYMAKIQEVPNAHSGTDFEPLEQVQYDTDDNVFANDIQHFDQSESISNTCAVEMDDSNVTLAHRICV
ncbi:hypothetical protein Tco_0716910 [Tanacetum coccineum]